MRVEPSELRYIAKVFVATRLLGYTLILMFGVLHAARTGDVSATHALSGVGQWDASWYHWIAVHGYDQSGAHGHHDNVWAFYPLYPLAYRSFGVLPGPLPLWGCVLSSMAFFAALLMLYAITRAEFDRRLARRVVLYMALFPMTMIFGVPYSESLFLALVLAAFVLTAQDRWWAGCAVGALAVLTRPLGIALVPALAWRARSSRRGLSAATAAPLFLLIVAQCLLDGFFWWQSGDRLANLHAEARGWDRGFTVLPIEAVHAVSGAVSGQATRFALVELAFTFLWYWLLWRVWRLDRPREYVIFAGTVVFITTWAGPLISVARLCMVAFPLFWGLADAGFTIRRDRCIRLVSALGLVAALFVVYGTRSVAP